MIKCLKLLWWELTFCRKVTLVLALKKKGEGGGGQFLKDLRKQCRMFPLAHGGKVFNFFIC